MVAVALGAAASVLLHAQEGESPQIATAVGEVVTTGESTGLSFELAAYSEGGTITAPATFVVTIQNRSDKVFQVEEIRLAPPDAFRWLRSAKLSWTLDCPSFRLEARRTLRCDLRAPSVKPSEVRRLFSADAIFFLPATYPVVATVKYGEAVPGKPQVSEPIEATLSLTPSLASLMAGGVMGAFLLAVFLGAHRFRQVLRAEGTDQLTWRRGLLFALRLGSQALFGSIVAVITILAIQRVADLEFPISVEIKDYLGGIVVGLLSTKLGETLYRKFLE